MGLLDSWKEKIAHYIDLRLRLLKLAVVERISGIMSYLILMFIVLFLSMSILIFLGVAFAEYFAEVLDSRSGAYLLTAGVLLLLFLSLFAFKKPIVRGISGVFIRILTEAGEDEEEVGAKKEKPKDDGALS